METIKHASPKVSIIIVNWNGGETFKKCLLSLNKNDYPNWELIVVDNGSKDNSQLLPQKLGYSESRYQLIKNTYNVGFASANNQGCKIARGKYVLFLNNDTVVEKNFLSILVDKMESDGAIGAVQPKIYILDKNGYLDNAGSFLTKIGFLEHWGFNEKDGKEFGTEKEVFSAKGACLLIRKEIIDKIGLFDPNFVSYFEESDFCWRVWLFGWKVLFYPKSKIFHKVGFTIKRLNVAEINFHYYKNRITSLIKNLEIQNLIIILPIHLFISLGIALAYLITLNFKSSAIIVKAIVWNIFNIRKILINRKKVQNLRRVNDKYIFDRLSHPVNFAKFYKDFLRVGKDVKN